jgi:hypothetical protein
MGRFSDLKRIFYLLKIASKWGVKMEISLFQRLEPSRSGLPVRQLRKASPSMSNGNRLKPWAG